MYSTSSEDTNKDLAADNNSLIKEALYLESDLIYTNFLGDGENEVFG